MTFKPNKSINLSVNEKIVEKENGQTIYSWKQIHKLKLLFHIVYYRYTDYVDRNYVVYTEKENRGQIIFNLSITFQAIYHQLGNIKNVIYGWIIVLSWKLAEYLIVKKLSRHEIFEASFNLDYLDYD